MMINKNRTILLLILMAMMIVPAIAMYNINSVTTLPEVPISEAPIFEVPISEVPISETPISEAIQPLPQSTINMRINRQPQVLYAFNFDNENFARLQDVAHLLSNTEKQFSIEPDSDARNITISRNSEIRQEHSDFFVPLDANINAVNTETTLIIDGETVIIDS
jgi:hypothetical protein